jgi:hypothetical protein
VPKTTEENEHYHYWTVNSSRTGLGGRRKTKHTHAIIINNETGDVVFGQMDQHTHFVQGADNGKDE